MAVIPNAGDRSGIRFRDHEGDTAWFNLYGEPGSRTSPPVVVVTLPYSEGRYRQIELDDADRRALVRHLLPEAADIIERWERRAVELRGDRVENEDWHDEADDQESEAWSEAATDLRTALGLTRPMFEVIAETVVTVTD